MSTATAISPSIERYRTIETKASASIEPIELTHAQADNVMASCLDLIDDDRYRPFFFKKLYTIGPARFVEQAEKARKYGKQPGKTFVDLLLKQKVGKS